MFKTIVKLFYLIFIFNLIIYIIPVSQKSITTKKDDILIDIIKNNVRDEYMSISVINDLSPNVFKTIIESGVYVEMNEFNNIDLHHAIDIRQSDYLVMYIIHNNPKSIFEQNIYNEYPLHRAIELKYHLDVIDELRNKGKQLIPDYQIIIEKQLNRDNKTIFELIALNY